MSDFKFEIGEEVIFDKRKRKVTYRYKKYGENYYVVTMEYEEEVAGENFLVKIPQPKKKLYQALFKSACGTYIIPDSLFLDEQAAKKFFTTGFIKLIEPGIEVDE